MKLTSTTLVNAIRREGRVIFHSFVTGEVNFLRKKGVIDLKLLKYSLKSDDQPGSSEILLSEVLEVHGVCY